MDINPELIHKVSISCDWTKAAAWCEENVGEFNQDWYKLGIDPLSGFRDGDPISEWCFKRERDAIMFVLRWS